MRGPSGSGTAELRTQARRGCRGDQPLSSSGGEAWVPLRAIPGMGGSGPARSRPSGLMLMTVVARYGAQVACGDLLYSGVCQDVVVSRALRLAAQDRCVPTQKLDLDTDLSGRIAVLGHGRIVAEASSGELKRRIPGGHVRLELANPDQLEPAGSARRDYSRRREPALPALVRGDGSGAFRASSIPGGSRESGRAGGARGRVGLLVSAALLRVRAAPFVATLVTLR